MLGKLLFNDSYIGPRWTYGLTIRPIASGNIPDGYIITSDRDHPDYRFGTLDYPTELPEDQLRRYDLVLVSTTPGWEYCPFNDTDDDPPDYGYWQLRTPHMPFFVTINWEEKEEAGWRVVIFNGVEDEVTTKVYPSLEKAVQNSQVLILNILDEWRTQVVNVFTHVPPSSPIKQGQRRTLWPA